jgi:hypothetical protein
MTKLRINKLDAARRQINAAIRMTFEGEDPVAIHSVIAAGHRIIRDICEQRGDIESYLRFTDWIAPGYEREFWHAMNASANFIKHADKDPDEIHELDDEASDYMIVFATKWYRDLGNSISTEMNVFATWWAVQHPNVLKGEILTQFVKAGISSHVEGLKKAMAVLDRADRLKAGLMFLNGRRS